MIAANLLVSLLLMARYLFLVGFLFQRAPKHLQHGKDPGADCRDNAEYLKDKFRHFNLAPRIKIRERRCCDAR